MQNDTFVVEIISIEWCIMDYVTLSSKYQMVIPKSVREKLVLEPGQRFTVSVHDDRIELVPVRDMKTMRGFLKGIRTDVPREADRA
jgi:AbrB family looped-hinge helix DNA binding protein